MILWSQSTKKITISCETLAYQWIFAEMFHSDEEFANPTCSSCITLVCVACAFDWHRFGKKKTGPKNDALRKVYLTWFLDSPMRSMFRETTPIYGSEELNEILLRLGR